MSETILELRVSAAAGKDASTMLCFDFIMQSPGLLLPNVQQLGWDLLPGAEEIQAFYLDSEGDRCLLTERSAPDVLSFAVVHKDDGSKLLEVQVQDGKDVAESGCMELLRSRLLKLKQEAAEAQTAKTVAEKELAATCGTLQAEVDAATRLAAAAEKSIAELKGLKASLKDKDDEIARLLAVNETLRAELAAARTDSRAQSQETVLSASVAECSPLVLGIEADDDSSKRGDASSHYQEDMERLGVQHAYRIGCMQLTSTDSGKPSESVPASAKLSVINSGAVQWPDTTVLVNVKGGNFGVPLIPLGAKAPGDSEEIIMDLLVPPRADESTASSMWAITNAATGMSFGPLIVLDVEWQPRPADEQK